MTEVILSGYTIASIRMIINNLLLLAILFIFLNLCLSTTENADRNADRL